MKDSKQEGRGATPFFARFLEDQHAAAEAQAETGFMTLKYPSDRDEGDVTLPPPPAKAAASKNGPSRMTLKYPSDRDEIDNYAAPYGNAADAS